MDTLAIALGTLLAAMPLILILLAWKSFRANPVPQKGWRKTFFRIALMGTISNYFLFWTDFLVVPLLKGPPDPVLALYDRIGLGGEVLSLICLVFSFAGAGVEIILAFFATVGVLLMWVSIGMQFTLHGN